MGTLEDRINVVVTKGGLISRVEAICLLERTSGGSFDSFLSRHNIVPVHAVKAKKYYLRSDIERLVVEENMAIQKEVIENISRSLENFTDEVEKIKGQLDVLRWSVSRDFFNAR